MTIEGETITSLNPPIYLIHIAGGLRAFVGSNGECFLGVFNSSELITFKIKPFESVVQMFDQLALVLEQDNSEIFGFQEFKTIEDLNRRLSESFNYVLPPSFVERNPIDYVSQWLSIASNLSNNEEGNKAAICKRIATQIERLIHRINALSDCYYYTLQQEKHLPEVGRFSLHANNDSQKVGLEFTSLLDNLYYLRDGLGNLVFRTLAPEKTKYRTIDLIKVLNKNDSELSKLLLNGLEKNQGIISQFSMLRGVAQHSMGEVNPTFGDVYSLRRKNLNGIDYFRLIFPLYDDWDKLAEIEQNASKGIFPKISQEECERFATETENHVDAFDFGLRSFNYLMKVSLEIFKEFNFDASPRKLDKEQILSMELRDENGDLVRYERNKKTGELEKCSDSK